MPLAQGVQCKPLVSGQVDRQIVEAEPRQFCALDRFSDQWFTTPDIADEEPVDALFHRVLRTIGTLHDHHSRERLECHLDAELFPRLTDCGRRRSFTELDMTGGTR